MTEDQAFSSCVSANCCNELSACTLERTATDACLECLAANGGDLCDAALACLAAASCPG